MPGLRTPTALFLLLTLLPAAILALLGFRGAAPWIDELAKAARGDLERAFDRTAAALPAAMQASDTALHTRLEAAARAAAARLPHDPPGVVLRDLEQQVGTALLVRRESGEQMLPRGVVACRLDHLVEWPRFCALQRACDRGEDLAGPPFEAAALQALAIATRLQGDPGRAATALQELPWPVLAEAGPRPVELLAASDAGRTHLHRGAAAGWLDAVPATEAARLAWYRKAGVGSEALAGQQVRAAHEAGEPMLRLTAAVVPGVELCALRTPAAALAALAAPSAGETQLALAPASAPTMLEFESDATARGALATPWGTVAITVTHLGLPRLQAEARRQRWLSGLGIGLLLALMATGLLLVRRALGRERRARQLRCDFIANVSHELKTPLTGLRLHAEMLADGGLDEAARQRYGEIAQGEGARLSALVDDLLDFAALEQGRRRLEPEPVDLGAAARAIVRSWQARALQDGIQLACEVTGTPAALVDGTAFARILTNLLQNACRHGRPPRRGAGSRITVRVGPGPRLVVADNGPGVPAAEQARLFTRFSHREGSGGIGIGLYLSRELATACGGTLEHEDTGDETWFVLRLLPVPELPLGEEVTA